MIAKRKESTAIKEKIKGRKKEHSKVHKAQYLKGIHDL